MRLFPAASISIHALREEGDRATSTLLLYVTISIHALREEGDEIYAQGNTKDNISIHALREEGDMYGMVFDLSGCLISIHALREEGDFRRRACRGR